MKFRAVVLPLLALVSCGQEPATKQPEADPAFPSSWATSVSNAWFPLTPGARWVYRATSFEGTERIVVTVLPETREVDGVTATVVHDQVTTTGGEIVEDTYDWYAQDSEGNVWYLGEDTTSYDEGVPSKEGSWEAGVDGAKAGILMLARPTPGEAYRQEYYRGHAEDRARVLKDAATVSVPAGEWAHVLQTEDSTPLEPDLVEHKFYAEGIGVVEERDVEGGDEHVVLVRFVKP